VNKVTCVIPFWNEGDRLYKVLDEVIKVKSLAQIICVDDASYKDKSNEIKKRYPNIQLIRLKNNVGKSEAIKEGMKFANGNYILLLDADLRNLKYQEIEKCVNAVINNIDIDMLILRRVKAPLFVKLTRGDILSTGERIIKKELLNEVLTHSKGWQLESALNIFMYKNNKKVYWLPHSGINTHFKWGFFTDIKYHKKKMNDIYHIGIFNFVKLFFLFGKTKL